MKECSQIKSNYCIYTSLRKLSAFYTYTNVCKSPLTFFGLPFFFLTFCSTSFDKGFLYYASKTLLNIFLRL